MAVNFGGYLIAAHVIWSKGPKAYHREGRLLANPLFQHPNHEMRSVYGWRNVRYGWNLGTGVSVFLPSRRWVFKVFDKDAVHALPGYA